MRAFLMMGRTLKAVYEELFLCVWLSLVWWLGTILVVTAAPATIGLQNVANRAANYKRVGHEFFWEAAKQNVGKGWLLYLLSLLAPVMFGFNMVFYLQTSGFTRLIGVVWFWCMVLWLLLGQYLFPMLLQQDEPNLRLAIRNAALIAVRYPLYSILILLFQILIAVLSFVLVLPFPILLPAIIAFTQNIALVGVLQEMGLAPQPPDLQDRVLG